MNQHSGKPTPSTSSQTPRLKSGLQAVLESLDVQLEAELTRYRRQKRGETVEPGEGRNGWQATQQNSLDLIALSPNQSSSDRPLEAPPQLNSNKSLELPEFVEGQSNGESNGNGSNKVVRLAIAQESKNGELSARSGESSASASAESNPPKEQTNGAVISTFKPATPDDYLESSEKLVKTLDEQEAKATKRRSRQDKDASQNSLWTPLGIGSMLLFVVASATLIYVLVNPPENSTVGAGGTVVDSASNSDADGGKPESISPDLTDPQFEPLDLEQLGTIQEEPATSSAPVGETALPEVPVNSPASPASAAPNETPTNSPGLSNLNTDYLTQSAQPADSLPPSSTQGSEPAPTNNAAGEIPATSAAPSPAPEASVRAQSFPNFYYVVMEYEDSESLWNARQVVPDAYVREFPIGVKIQVAAFEDEASAKMMVEQMTQQGINAQVYQP